MNKTELIKALAEKTGKSQKEAKAFLEAFESTVKETLSKGDKIALIGFGSWDVQDVPARARSTSFRNKSVPTLVTFILG